MGEGILQTGRDAFARAAWPEAVALLGEDEAAQPSDLMMLAEALFWTGDREGSTDAYQRAYAAYIATGDHAGAARAARRLVADAVTRNDGAVATGWYGRAHRLLDDEDECAEHAALALMDSIVTLNLGRDPDAAISKAREAAELAKRFGDRDVEAGAMDLEGNALVRQGRVKDGMALIDQAMAAAVGGELSPVVTAQIYCGTISICLALHDYRRAAEWTATASRCATRPGMSDFHGDCRLHRCEVQGVRGSWDLAVEEAEQAAREAESFDLHHVGLAHYTVGYIRLRRGDLDGAEASFEQARRYGWDPEPGSALVLTARGEHETAQVAIREPLEQGSWDPLVRAKLLPAQVEIALAAGDVATAREAADDLRAIAETFQTDGIRAATAVTHGATLLAEGKTSAAIDALRGGVVAWRHAGAPYEAERARAHLARALAASGDRSAAKYEAERAGRALEEMGARRDAEAASQLVRDLGAAAETTRVTRTFMFTDMVDSTSLLEAMGDDAWDALLDRHDETLRSLFAGHGGREVKHQGDGFFVAFREGGLACDCAVAIQRALAELRRSHGFAPRVRIGLHSTEATEASGDYRGLGVNIAARIGALAGANDILASLDTVRAIELPMDGEPMMVELKGLKQPIEVARIAWT